MVYRWNESLNEKGGQGISQEKVYANYIGGSVKEGFSGLEFPHGAFSPKSLGWVQKGGARLGCREKGSFQLARYMSLKLARHPAPNALVCNVRSPLILTKRELTKKGAGPLKAITLGITTQVSGPPRGLSSTASPQPHPRPGEGSPASGGGAKGVAHRRLLER